MRTSVVDDSRAPATPDKLLFTPGPLTTSAGVKRAMLRDLGSRDREFISVVAEVRRRLLEIAGVSKTRGHEAIPVQGSGTFGLESVVSSCVPPDGTLLVIANGAYGERIARIARVHEIATQVLSFPECDLPAPEEVERFLAEHPAVTTVAAVHCETTTGIFNPVARIGEIAARHGKTYILDSMSAFGAVPLDLAGSGVDYLVSSANKCIEGVPGISFVICRREALEKAEGWARTLSLDLVDQWRGLERNGQFRFTPPTQVLLAFLQALRELEEEGGATGRAARYRRNHEILVRGMREMGFEEYLAPERQGYIITSFRYPGDPRFAFDDFYRRLADRGMIIYPGKVSDAACFRIGTIGRLFAADSEALLSAIREVLGEMGIASACPS
jgi:2-aminoethylphosphonate-pyruvate transaminase